MYDNHINTRVYGDLKGRAKALYEGLDVDDDIAYLKNDVDDAYEQGKISSSQYDNLYSIIDDIDY